MTWAYRVMRRKITLGNAEEYAYGIYEVYDDDEVVGHSWTVDAMAPHGETLEELRADFDHMANAFEAPTLDHETGKPI